MENEDTSPTEPETPGPDEPEPPRPEEALTSAFEEGWTDRGGEEPAEGTGASEPPAPPGETKEWTAPVEPPAEREEVTHSPAPTRPVAQAPPPARLDTVEARAAEILDGVRSTVGELEERLVGALTGVSDVTQGMLSTAVEAFSSTLRQLTQRLETAADRTDVDALRKALAEAFDAFQGQLRATMEATNKLPERIEAAVKRTQEALGALGKGQEQLRTDIAAMGAQAAEQGRAGVAHLDELARAFQDMAKRRGLKALVEGEERMLEEQQGLIARLAVLEERVGEAVVAIERQEGLQKAVSALEGRMAQLAGALEERVSKVSDLERTLSQDLRKEAREVLDAALARFQKNVPDALLGESGIINLRDLVERQSLTEKAIAVLGRETKDLLKKLEGWGKPRSAPRLAQQVDDMDGRLAELEGGVSAELVEGVSARLEGLFERRFEALIRLLETRVRQISESQQIAEEEPGGLRGLFRRSRE